MIHDHRPEIQDVDKCDKSLGRDFVPVLFLIDRLARHWRGPRPAKFGEASALRLFSAVIGYPLAMQGMGGIPVSFMCSFKKSAT